MLSAITPGSLRAVRAWPRAAASHAQAAYHGASAPALLKGAVMVPSLITLLGKAVLQGHLLLQQMLPEYLLCAHQLQGSSVAPVPLASIHGGAQWLTVAK